MFWFFSLSPCRRSLSERRHCPALVNDLIFLLGPAFSDVSRSKIAWLQQSVANSFPSCITGTKHSPPFLSSLVRWHILSQAEYPTSLFEEDGDIMHFTDLFSSHSLCMQSVQSFIFMEHVIFEYNN